MRAPALPLRARASQEGASKLCGAPAFSCEPPDRYSADHKVETRTRNPSKRLWRRSQYRSALHERTSMSRYRSFELV